MSETNENDNTNKNASGTYAKAIIISSIILSLSLIYMQNKRIGFEKDQEAKQEAEKVLYDSQRLSCLNQAYFTFLDNWNTECKTRGLKKDCSLPMYLANSKDKDHKDLKAECFKLYPVK
jgi:hypothetical protein